MRSFGNPLPYYPPIEWLWEAQFTQFTGLSLQEISLDNGKKSVLIIYSKHISTATKYCDCTEVNNAMEILHTLFLPVRTTTELFMWLLVLLFCGLLVQFAWVYCYSNWPPTYQVKRFPGTAAESTTLGTMVHCLRPFYLIVESWTVDCRRNIEKWPHLNDRRLSTTISSCSWYSALLYANCSSPVLTQCRPT